MKKIQLTQGQEALVDDADYEEFSKYKWHALWDDHTKSFYAARRSPRVQGKQTTIQMHRVIMGNPYGLEIDHRDHDTLNNQRYNLRIATHSQNCANRRKQIGNQSGFKGVTASNQRWMARIGIGGQLLYLGTYDSPSDAARAYDSKIRELYGEFAETNFVSDETDTMT